MYWFVWGNMFEEVVLFMVYCIEDDCKVVNIILCIYDVSNVRCIFWIIWFIIFFFVVVVFVVVVIVFFVWRIDLLYGLL